jgi:hypothetical protein
MDKRWDLEQDLLGRAAKAVEPLGLKLQVLGREPAGPDAGVDATVRLRYGGRQLRYFAEIKRGLRPATLGPVLQQLRRYRGRPLLVADFVTPPLADALRAQGVEFIDTAGNAFLTHPPLLIFVKGQRPTEKIPAAERGRAFQATGLQVLFALLTRPELVARPYREIARAAGVAHGTVGWVMAELPGLGYAAEVRGRRRLTNGKRLLDQWVEAYARTLRPRLLLGRFRGDVAALQERIDVPQGALVGGEIAAARMTGHLRPATATFYVARIEPKNVFEWRLRADVAGNVDLRRRFWNFPEDTPPFTPALLVYADLLAIGDARCLETAELLRERLLDRTL